MFIDSISHSRVMNGTAPNFKIIMATKGFVYALILILSLETTVANCQNCDFSSNGE